MYVLRKLPHGALKRGPHGLKCHPTLEIGAVDFIEPNSTKNSPAGRRHNLLNTTSIYRYVMHDCFDFLAG